MDDPGRARGLHRLRDLRRDVPCPLEGGGPAQVDRPGAEGRAPRVERERYEFFLSIPEIDRTLVAPAPSRARRCSKPLFEYSGACEGCGETPYLKLVTQLFGDRLLVANATGCSSIYGGNCRRHRGRPCRGPRPAWSNSLFEDNAEFGLVHAARARPAGGGSAAAGRGRRPGSGRRDSRSRSDDRGGHRRASASASRRSRSAAARSAPPKLLDCSLSRAPSSGRRSWIVGGDGWAYDIGFGGLDHVLASGRNVNLLVLDTEVYSNTGGQASKATPRAAVAKFAAGGKRTRKKDLGMIASAYGDVYVAQIAMGADNPQTVKALAEADAYPGPSLVIAYSHCIAPRDRDEEGHGAAEARGGHGYWPLYRYDPRYATAGEHPSASTRGRPSSRCPSSWTERPASRCSSEPTSGRRRARRARPARRRRALARIRAARGDRARSGEPRTNDDETTEEEEST